MLPKYLARIRVGIVLLSLLSLATAILNSIDALFVEILRDQSRGSRATATTGTCAAEFLALQRSVSYMAVTSAITTTLFAILGLVTAINPAWLRKYSVCQTIQGILLVSMGGYAAERVRGCGAEFGRLFVASNSPYYIVIYYGYIAQAAYGFLLMTTSLVLAAMIPICEDTRDSRLQALGSC